MKRINKRKITIIIVLLIVSLCFLQIKNKKIRSVEPFFSLVAIVPPLDNIAYDYMTIIKQNLANIGINLDIIFFDHSYFDLIYVYHNFDLCYIQYDYSSIGSFLNIVYNENGSLNFSGYNTELDYDEQLGTGKNEWMIQQINTIYPPDSTERYEQCWDWQYYLMDEIVPCYPLFVENDYLLLYNNLKGFNFDKGLIQSWGNLSWDGTHIGQISQNEINIADNSWIDLNPVIHSNNQTFSDKFIIDCIMDPLIWRDNDYTYWPHLTTNWTHLNNSHVRMTLRDGIKWQDDPEDKFTNEYFDAEDVFFTLYLNKMVDALPWLIDFKIVDSLTVDIYLGNNPQYTNNIVYNNYLDDLSQIKILPEHYLNQSQLIDGITPDIAHNSWLEFSKKAFGTGLMEISDYLENYYTSLSLFENCWWMDSQITQDSSINWEPRFGNFINCPEILNIKIINENQRENQFYLGYLDLLPRTTNEILDYENHIHDYPSINILSKLSTHCSIIGFNLREERELIGDTDKIDADFNFSLGYCLRKAISYAIDREEINEIIHGGKMSLNNFPISPHLSKWCNSNMPNYCYNYDYAWGFMCLWGSLSCFDFKFPPGFPDWRYGCCDPCNITSSSASVNSYY
ncbi:MAG: hypothetical protein FK731_14115 [Asgard group archaeon]|nr:hypothetical protein [Asgard group archaeon]